MKLKIVRWFALLIGTVVNVWLFTFLGLFIVHFIGELIDGDEELFGFKTSQNIEFFILSLSVVSIVIAWFKSKIGGFLITLSAILFLIFNVAYSLRRSEFPIYVLLFSGLLLLFYVYYNEWQTKNT